MASSVAAKLRQESDVQVEMVRGGLGEFSVTIDDREVVNTNRLWYPNPSSVVKTVRSALAAKDG
ncbi:MAG: hypothetical protein WAU45_05980 [Blastocatellia bacterium]